jgi:hypothetical protein
LLLATAGSVLVTIFVGTLIQRLGVPALLAVAGFCLALGAVGFGLAPGFGFVLDGSDPSPVAQAIVKGLAIT